MKDNKSTLPFFTFLAVFNIFLFTTLSHAQDQEEYGIYESIDNNYLGKQNSSKSNKKSTINSRNDFYNLSQNLHSTYYFENGTLNAKYGNGLPTKLTFEDLSSFNSLNNNDLNYANVELITIKLNDEKDLNTNIDLSSLVTLTNLKYVYIKCLFTIDSKQIKKLVKKSNVRVFYTSLRPS